MIASSTQIRPTSFKGRILLLFHIVRVRRQLASARGLLKMDFHPGWRTLTVWETAEDMKAFRNNGAHLDAMRATAKIGSARTVTWEVDRPPTWPEVLAKFDRS